MCPYILHGIEFGSIAREAVHLQPAPLAGEELRDFGAAMGGETVPQQNHAAWEVAAQRTQEGLDVNTPEAAWLQGKKETPPFSLGITGQRADGGEALVVKGLSQHRSLAPRRPGASYAGALGEATFVGEDEGGMPPGALFLSLGQHSSSHWEIAASLRSLARRAGFWEVHFRRRNSHQR